MHQDSNRTPWVRGASIDPRHASRRDEPEPVSALRRALPRVAIGIVLAIIVASTLALFADVRSLGASLERFDWWLVLPVLGLTLLNYALRWVKWHVYLQVVNVPRITVIQSVLAFLSAFSMALTPGKVGELIKAVHVHRLTRSPVSRIAAVIAAERITDGLAMIGLAAIGFLQFSQGRPVMAVAAVLGIGAVVLLRHPVILQLLTRRLERVPIVGPLIAAVAHHIEGFLDASNRLYAPQLVGGSVALGMVSWACECMALMIVLAGLGLEPSWNLLLVSTFVLSVSSVLGALSMLPGGLGVAEASLAGLLLLLIDDPSFSRADAAAATLLIRFATLWFGVLLGVVALLVLQRFGRPTTQHV
jgi:glycosyltransferase 2 family protein